jgi:hypothetical protein
MAPATMDSRAVQKLNAAATRLIAFVLRDFQFYTILHTNEPAPKKPLATNILRRPVSTMASSGFGPHHGLWHDNAPTKRIGLMPTPWTMADALGLVQMHQAHE